MTLKPSRAVWIFCGSHFTSDIFSRREGKAEGQRASKNRLRVEPEQGQDRNIHFSMKQLFVFHPAVHSTACSSPDHACVSLQGCANFPVAFLPLIQVNSLVALKLKGRKKTMAGKQGRAGSHVPGPGSFPFE